MSDSDSDQEVDIIDFKPGTYEAAVTQRIYEPFEAMCGVLRRENTVLKSKLAELEKFRDEAYARLERLESKLTNMDGLCKYNNNDEEEEEEDNENDNDCDGDGDGDGDVMLEYCMTEVIYWSSMPTFLHRRFF